MRRALEVSRPVGSAKVWTNRKSPPRERGDRSISPHLSRGCANTPGIGAREHAWDCRGGARTRLGSFGDCAAGAASCGSVLVGLSWVRGVRSCCSVAASLRLDPFDSGAPKPARIVRARLRVSWRGSGLVIAGLPSRGLWKTAGIHAGSRHSQTPTHPRPPAAGA